MSEQSKDKLLSVTLKYKGKLLKSEGTRKNKVNDDVNWKLWQLLFDTEGMYDWKCSCFEPITDKSVQIKDMEEGQYYEVVYKEESYQHPQYGNQKSKKVVLIKMSSEDNKTDILTNKESSIKQLPVTEDGWKTFAQEYDEATNGEGNSMHMLGAYVANNCTEEFNNVIELCKKHFNK